MPEILKILIVDDDEIDRMAVRRALKLVDGTMEITEAEDSASASLAFNAQDFDCAFIDYRLPDTDGLELIRRLRGGGVKTPLIVLTGQADDQIAVDLMKAGASDYLSKYKISPAGLIKTLQNAIRIHQAEQEAAIANEQKIELARQKDDFVSRMTHDLRTPLVAANRMLEMFQGGLYGEISPEMKEAIQAIIRNNQNLLEMVSNLLEVYCHEAGEKRLNLTTLTLADIIYEVVRHLKPLADDKNVKLVIEEVPTGSDPVKLLINGDRLELQRVFMNLIGNAIKFTDEGWIRVRLTEANPRNPWIKIEVQDTGAGISPSDRASLFERFHQGKHRRSTSGLGLYLSRRIIEAHNGTIEVESEVNQGSTFTVFLPSAHHHEKF
ncbi:MAG: hybrid sensor histidine kinase/response regulator [Snowella sp.]|nr:hybrid sensor histidine kinase/response regulator [Snowella sp.]